MRINEYIVFPTAFLLGIFTIQLGVLGMFNGLKSHYGEKPLSPEKLVMTPPRQPRLQIDEAGDMKRYREQQKHLLESYGWVDRKTGIVRIPIDKAMVEMLK